MTGHHPILLVEDDDDVRETLAEYLQFRGYEVIAAAHGGEALDVLREQGLVCMILLDLMMPQMDGYQFRAAQLQDHQLADIPVVVITAGASPRVRELDPVEVFKKPLDLARLITAIEQHC